MTGRLLSLILARQRKLTVNDVMRDGAACSSELETCREIAYR